MKVGVIGLGSIGSRHANNLKILGHEVIPYDIKQPIEWPEPPHASLDDIWNHADAVVIASPTPTHLDYICDAICKGRANALFVEKPIADKESTSISAECVTMVGYNLRFHSCVIQAKEWIDVDHLGDPLWGNFVVAQYNDKYTDHVILNWSHEIDLALYLLGPLAVQTCASNSNGMADITLHNYLKHCTVTIHLDYVTKPEIRQTIIVGSKATIIMDLVSRHAWLRNSEGVIIDSFVGDDTWDSNYLDEMETFIARVEGKETIGCTGQEGLEVLKICLEAKRLSQSP